MGCLHRRTGECLFHHKVVVFTVYLHAGKPTTRPLCSALGRRNVLIVAAERRFHVIGSSSSYSFTFSSFFFFFFKLFDSINEFSLCLCLSVSLSLSVSLCLSLSLSLSVRARAFDNVRVCDNMCAYDSV